MKNASSEERYNFEIWYVLNEINYQLLRNKKNKIIRYVIYPSLSLKEKVSFFRQQEILKMLEDEGVIIKKEGISGTKDPDVFGTGEEGTSKYRVFLHYYFEPTDKFNKYYEKYKQLVGDNDISSLFGFDEYTFKLKRIDNTYAVINFYPQKDYGYNTFYLMSFLVKELKRNYKRNGNLVEAFIDRNKIAEYIQKQLPNENITTDWMKTTKGNLIKKIPKEYTTLIKVGNYDQKLKGYSFSIQLPY